MSVPQHDSARFRYHHTHNTIHTTTSQERRTLIPPSSPRHQALHITRREGALFRLRSRAALPTRRRRGNLPSSNRAKRCGACAVLPSLASSQPRRWKVCAVLTHGTKSVIFFAGLNNFWMCISSLYLPSNSEENYKCANSALVHQYTPGRRTLVDWGDGCSSQSWCRRNFIPRRHIFRHQNQTGLPDPNPKPTPAWLGGWVRWRCAIAKKHAFLCVFGCAAKTSKWQHFR